MKKKLAVIGCGLAAVPILTKAREIGVETYCFAKEEMPIAKNLSDHFISIDFMDYPKLYQECLKINPNGIIATSEITTEIVAKLAKALNLRGNEYGDNFSYRNKYIMRKNVAKSAIVKQPNYYYYDKSITIKFPVVVKAPDSCGKNGISLATNEEEFKEALKYSQEVSNNGQVLIEEYLAGGEEFSVECLSYRGKHYIIQITEKYSSGAPHFVELGHHQPANITNEVKAKIDNGLKEILTLVGIRNSMSHVEIKVINNDIYFIELGARAGGDFIADTLVALSTDYDYFKGAITIALDEFKEPKFKQTYHSGVYFLCKQTESLTPLFKIAKDKDWCIKCELPKNKLANKDKNNDSVNNGYLIYQSDHKITLKDYPFEVVRANEQKNIKKELLAFYNKIGSPLSKEELDKGLQKFIDYGNIFIVNLENEIIAMLNLYCNNQETKESYINNVYVLENYRGLGLSKKILSQAIDFSVKAGFKSIHLHVEKNNSVAINLYEQYGFKLTNKTKIIDNKVLYEMIKTINQE